MLIRFLYVLDEFEKFNGTARTFPRQNLAVIKESQSVPASDLDTLAISNRG